MGVLRDVFVLGMLALAIALAAYAAIRHHTEHQWHADGNVLSRPYDGTDGIVALMLVLFFGWVLFQLPVDGATDPAKNTSAVSESALLMNAVFFLTLCILLLLYLGLYRGLNPAEMFGLRHSTVGQAAFQALILVIIVYVLVQLVTWLVYTKVLGGGMPEDGAQEAVKAFKNTKSLSFKMLLGIAAVVIAPLTEEMIFRGFLYGVTKRFTDRWFAALFSSLMFAVVHQNVAATLPLFLLAMGLATAYEVTGCLLVPIFMHGMFNAWNVALLAVQ